jgi:hypothetical protein
MFIERFPEPACQAEALLEICQGDIGEAQEVAITNFKFAKCQKDQLYWTRVEDLISKQDSAVVMERLSNNKLKRNATQPVSDHLWDEEYCVFSGPQFRLK